MEHRGKIVSSLSTKKVHDHGRRGRVRPRSHKLPKPRCRSQTCRTTRFRVVATLFYPRTRGIPTWYPRDNSEMHSHSFLCCLLSCLPSQSVPIPQLDYARCAHLHTEPANGSANDMIAGLSRGWASGSWPCASKVPGALYPPSLSGGAAMRWDELRVEKESQQEYGYRNEMEMVPRACLCVCVCVCVRVCVWLCVCVSMCARCPWRRSQTETVTIIRTQERLGCQPARARWQDWRRPIP